MLNNFLAQFTRRLLEKKKVYFWRSLPSPWKINNHVYTFRNKKLKIYNYKKKLKSNVLFECTAPYIIIIIIQYFMMIKGV